MAAVFTGLRETLKDYPDAQRVERVVVPLLDFLVRPCTDRWLRWIENGAFREDGQRSAFRTELRELRIALGRVEVLLGAVREARELVPDDLFLGLPIHRRLPTVRSHRALAPIESKSVDDEQTDVFAAEHRDILARRAANDEGGAGTNDALTNAFGLALSGGGIRSATFSLGVAQVLAERGLLRRADYLSTVSGGGYFGTFLTCCLHDSPCLPDRDRAKELLSSVSGTDTPQVRHLRDRSRYLLEGGVRAKLKVAMTMVFGVASNLIALIPLITLLALVTFAVREWTDFWGGTDWETALPNMAFQVIPPMTVAWIAALGANTMAIRWIWHQSTPARSNPSLLQGIVALVADSAALLVTSTVIIGGLLWIVKTATENGGASIYWPHSNPDVSPSVAFAYYLTIVALSAQLFFRPVWSLHTRGSEPGSVRAWWRDRADKATNCVMLVAAAAWLVASIPALFYWHAQHTWNITLSSALAIVVGVLSGLLALKSRSKVIGGLMRLPFAISPAIFFVTLYLGVTALAFHWTGEAHETPQALLVVGFAVITVGLWFFMDLNALSPHGFYKRKLAGCYVVGSDDQGNVKPIEKLRLSELGLGAPYHLINAAVNLPGSDKKELRGRKGDFFLFSKHYSGSRITGYVKSKDLEEHDRAFDISSAMAVSGAAVSSNMGVNDAGRLRFFLALLNVRLGYWIPNVNNLGLVMGKAYDWIRHRCTPGPGFLRREMFGRMNEGHCFLNVSDGGHIENLGVFELLRRRCKFIISVDGECDPDRDFDGIVKLIRYARIDLGAEIDIDLSQLSTDDAGLSRAHSALGKIKYGDGSMGWLLYLKTSLTGNETRDILDYKREQPAFPHESTTDQLYSEKQFEAYRALGEHIAREHFASDILSTMTRSHAAQSAHGKTSIQDWFHALAMNMLPDNDEVFASDETNLEGLEVGISISDPGTGTDINQPTRVYCEALISMGATVVLGHDWQKDGIMAKLAEYAAEDRKLHSRKETPAIINIVPRGRTMPVGGAHEKEIIYVEQSSEASIEAFRAVLNTKCNARICVGGKRTRQTNQNPDGFTGGIPGILEEAWRASEAGQCVLISGCLDGAAKWLVESLQGRSTEKIDYDGQAAAKEKLPSSEAALVADMKKSFARLDARELALHERLWQTTQVDASLAVMIEILDVYSRRIG